MGGRLMAEMLVDEQPKSTRSLPVAQSKAGYRECVSVSSTLGSRKPWYEYAALRLETCIRSVRRPQRRLAERLQHYCSTERTVSM